MGIRGLDAVQVGQVLRDEIRYLPLRLAGDDEQQVIGTGSEIQIADLLVLGDTAGDGIETLLGFRVCCIPSGSALANRVIMTTLVSSGGGGA